jgi:hypothetical protein
MSSSGKILAAALGIALLIVAAGVKRQRTLSSHLQTTAVERDLLRTNILVLQERLTEISNRAAIATAAPQVDAQKETELLRLRSEVSQLRKATNEMGRALHESRQSLPEPGKTRVEARAVPAAIPANISNSPIPSSTLPPRPPDPPFLQTAYDMSRLGDLQALETLLESNPDFLNMPVGVRGSTLLHTAAYNDHPDVIEVLLKRGASVDQRNIAGETPLFSAVLRGGSSSIEALLKAGANPNTPDNNGLTPLKVATDRNLSAVADLLRKHGGQ